MEMFKFSNGVTRTKQNSWNSQIAAHSTQIIQSSYETNGTNKMQMITDGPFAFSTVV